MMERAYCSARKLAEFAHARGWELDDLSNWLGVPGINVVGWLHGREEVPGPVARLVQIEEEVGQYLCRSTGDREDLIWGAYFDAKNALALEYHWPDQATAGAVAGEPENTN